MARDHDLSACRSYRRHGPALFHLGINIAVVAECLRRTTRRRSVPLLCGLLTAALWQTRDLQADNASPVSAVQAQREGHVSLPEELAFALQTAAQSLATSSVTSSVKREYVQEPGKPTPTRRGDEEIFKCFDGGRVYHRSKTVINRRDGTKRRRTTEVAFDGTVFYFGNPNEGSTPMLIKYLGDNLKDEDARDPLLEDPYLEAAGVFVPPTPIQWKTRAVGSLVLEWARMGKVVDYSLDDECVTLRLEMPDPVITHANEIDIDKWSQELKRGGTDPDFLNRELGVFRHLRSRTPVRRVTFTLDREKGYAVRRREEFTADGSRIQTTECEDFQHHEEKGLWLPSKCTTRHYTPPGTLARFSEVPYLTVTTRLVDLSFEKQSDVAFVIDYNKAGAIIADRSTVSAREAPGGQIETVVGADPETLRNSAKFAMSRSTSLRTVLVIANVVVFAVLGFVYLFVRRRSAS